MDKKFTVIKDTREKKQGWTFSLDKYCAGTIKQALKTGDYGIAELPENVFTIERKKSVGEIYNNLFQERFTKELERLAEFKHKFIICQFDLKTIMSFPVNSGIPARYWEGVKANANYIMSRLINIHIKYGIPVIYAGQHSQDLAKFYLRQVARTEGII